MMSCASSSASFGRLHNNIVTMSSKDSRAFLPSSLSLWSSLSTASRITHTHTQTRTHTEATTHECYALSPTLIDVRTSPETCTNIITHSHTQAQPSHFTLQFARVGKRKTRQFRETQKKHPHTEAFINATTAGGTASAC